MRGGGGYRLLSPRLNFQSLSFLVHVQSIVFAPFRQIPNNDPVISLDTSGSKGVQHLYNGPYNLHIRTLAPV